MKELPALKGKLMNIYEPVCDHKSVWPAILPKNYKRNGRHYIHYACEAQDIEMLNRAIVEDHDLLRNDMQGNNAMTAFLRGPTSKEFIYHNSFNSRVDASFLKTLLQHAPTLWQPSIHGLDFFQAFAKMSYWVFKVEFGKNAYNKQMHEQLCKNFSSCIDVLHQFNCELKIDSSQFMKIKFHSILDAFFLSKAFEHSPQNDLALEYLLLQASHMSNEFFLGCKETSPTKAPIGYMAVSPSYKPGMSNIGVKQQVSFLDNKDVWKFWDQTLLSLDTIKRHLSSEGRYWKIVELGCPDVIHYLLNKNLHEQLQPKESTRKIKI